MNRANINAFISKAANSFSSEFPTWERNARNNTHPSICIPPYFETARKNLEHENLAADQKGNRGDVSEQKIFDALKSLNNGIVVIANVDSVDIEEHAGIVWKEYKNSCSISAEIKGLQKLRQYQSTGMHLKCV